MPNDAPPRYTTYMATSSAVAAAEPRHATAPTNSDREETREVTDVVGGGCVFFLVFLLYGAVYYVVEFNAAAETTKTWKLQESLVSSIWWTNALIAGTLFMGVRRLDWDGPQTVGTRLADSFLTFIAGALWHYVGVTYWGACYSLKLASMGYTQDDLRDNFTFQVGIIFVDPFALASFIAFIGFMAASVKSLGGMIKAIIRIEAARARDEEAPLLPAVRLSR